MGNQALTQDKDCASFKVQSMSHNFHVSLQQSSTTTPHLHHQPDPCRRIFGDARFLEPFEPFESYLGGDSPCGSPRPKRESRRGAKVDIKLCTVLALFNKLFGVVDA
mmetsp:Transcript_21994/g.50253  ORF Transcript_21994/g.50253 Transcript_21994/m.50253 type:complete len:107 (-) Transcript_21994:2064-2384(-)